MNTNKSGLKNQQKPREQIMKKLPKITHALINGSDIDSANSRDIYKYLEIKQGYSDWIKYQISKLNLKEDIDFTKHIYVIGKNKVTDYIVTTDVAKNIGLISFTEKGQVIRNHFIEAEKKATQVSFPKNALKEIKLALAGVVELDERLDVHNDRLIQLEENRRIETWQEKQLQDAHHAKVYAIASQYGEDAEDRTLIRKLHAKAWKLFKKKFSLPRYNEISVGKFEDGLTYIKSLSLKDFT